MRILRYGKYIFSFAHGAFWEGTNTKETVEGTMAR